MKIYDAGMWVDAHLENISNAFDNMLFAPAPAYTNFDIIIYLLIQFCHIFFIAVVLINGVLVYIIFIYPVRLTLTFAGYIVPDKNCELYEFAVTNKYAAREIATGYTWVLSKHTILIYKLAS